MKAFTKFVPDSVKYFTANKQYDIIHFSKTDNGTVELIIFKDDDDCNIISKVEDCFHLDEKSSWEIIHEEGDE